MREGAGLLTLVAAVVLGTGQLGASCVDGVTPDCGDSAVCAPSLDGSDNGPGLVVVPEGGEDAGGEDAADASDADAGRDADADARGG